MDEQKVACARVLEEIKKDRATKGSKRKKIDHWKPYACEAIGIKKMGNARWQMILDYGYKQGYFEVEEVNGKEALVPTGEKKQTPLLDPAPQKEEEVLSREPRREKEQVRERSILKDVHRTSLVPRKGDVLWAIRPDNSVFQGEVEEVNIGVHVTPLNKKDGYWSYVLSNDLFEGEKEAKKEASARSTSRSRTTYWSKDAMGKQELSDFEEYMTHRDEFLKWLKTKKEDEELISDL